MNSIIKKQLDNCNLSLPEYDEDTTYIFIPKNNRNNVVSTEIEIQKDHYYILELENYIINPPDNFTLSSNWNKGINPKSKYLFGTPTNFVGKMVRWDCCGYDINSNQPLDDVYSELWLPRKGFKMIREVKNK